MTALEEDRPQYRQVLPTLTVRGMLNGKKMSLTWVDGVLGGDDAAIRRAEQMIERKETIIDRSTGLKVFARIDTEHNARVTMIAVFDDLLGITRHKR